MILKSISPCHFGPFTTGAVLEIDPKVTVLTGPNDVGKSLALRAIQILCMEDAAAAHEVNRFRSRDFNGKWEDDPELLCHAEFEVSQLDVESKAIFKQWKPSIVCKVRKRMNIKRRVVEVTHAPSHVNDQTNRLPDILWLPLPSEIRKAIPIRQMSDAEANLIQLGFGNHFNIDAHVAQDHIDRGFVIRDAQERLNEQLMRLFPSAMHTRFSLIEGEAPDVIGVGIIDGAKGLTPITSRGSGVRRIINVMGALLRLDPNGGHCIVLYDEPENSLHADSQHKLRRLLEELAERETIQVIYSTHSPAMINTARPHSIRLVERRTLTDRPASFFVNRAFEGNYSQVRSSLGVSPADSLLYGPITLVAEGVTEVLCLPLVLMKLAEAEVIDQTILDVVLPQTHILDGEGAKFEYMCRLAKSQRAKPVLFLDGDKNSELPKIREKHPEVPIVELPLDKEFEDIVPSARYIEAAANLSSNSNADISEQAFRHWEKQTAPKLPKMFSKRIERWLDEEFNVRLNKPRLMEEAIKLTDAKDILVQPFERLVQEMKAISDSL